MDYSKTACVCNLCYLRYIVHVLVEVMCRLLPYPKQLNINGLYVMVVCKLTVLYRIICGGCTSTVIASVAVDSKILRNNLFLCKYLMRSLWLVDLTESMAPQIYLVSKRYVIYKCYDIMNKCSVQFSKKWNVFFSTIWDPYRVTFQSFPHIEDDL